MAAASTLPSQCTCDAYVRCIRAMRYVRCDTCDATRAMRHVRCDTKRLVAPCTPRLPCPPQLKVQQQAALLRRLQACSEPKWVQCRAGLSAAAGAQSQELAGLANSRAEIHTLQVKQSHYLHVVANTKALLQHNGFRHEVSRVWGGVCVTPSCCCGGRVEAHGWRRGLAGGPEYAIHAGTEIRRVQPVAAGVEGSVGVWFWVWPWSWGMSGSPKFWLWDHETRSFQSRRGRVSLQHHGSRNAPYGCRCRPSVCRGCLLCGAHTWRETHSARRSGLMPVPLPHPGRAASIARALSPLIRWPVPPGHERLQALPGPQAVPTLRFVTPHIL